MYRQNLSHAKQLRNITEEFKRNIYERTQKYYENILFENLKQAALSGCESYRISFDFSHLSIDSHHLENILKKNEFLVIKLDKIVNDYIDNFKEYWTISW